MSATDFIGKKVRVEWEYLDPVEGTVTYSPCATGDCWEIETENEIAFTQEIIRKHIKIQSFARMTFIEQTP